MCLYIGKNSSFIAKSDIIVYKELKQIGKNDYVTPCQDFPVKLDNLLIPEGIATEKPCGFKYRIEEGTIHAYTSSNGNDLKFKAIIKKGTKFWIQDDLIEVAAEKLYITSELAGKEETDLSEYIKEFGVDVYLKDGRRCKITDSFDKKDVIGVYGYDNQVIALEYKYSRFFNEELPNEISKNNFIEENSCNRSELITKLEKDLDGYGNTKQLKALGIKSDALDYCEKLGKDWYIPSLGQVKLVAENMLRINLTLKNLGKDILPFSWFWSSTLKSFKCAWDCCSIGGSWYGYDCSYGRVCFCGYVLPFLELS